MLASIPSEAHFTKGVYAYNIASKNSNFKKFCVFSVIGLGLSGSPRGPSGSPGGPGWDLRESCYIPFEKGIYDQDRSLGAAGAKKL